MAIECRDLPPRPAAARHTNRHETGTAGPRTRAGALLAATGLAAAILAVAALVSAQGADSLRLDNWTESYAPNTEAPEWHSDKFAPLMGKGDRYFFEFVHKGEEHYLHVASGRNNSFTVGLNKGIAIKDWPILEWDWKMGVLPKGGDVRVKEKDDQAGSMCVVLDPGISFDSSLCYLFENDGPKDTPLTGTKKSQAKYLILRTAKSGDPIGQWLHERRNVYEDYKRAFGKEPQKPGFYGVQIDSNDTESAAEAYYRNIVLHKS